MARSIRLVMLIKNLHIHFMKSLYALQGYENEFKILLMEPKNMLPV